MRLDVYLTTTGKAASRTRAQELISGGFVTVSGKKVLKPSFAIEENWPPPVAVTGEIHPYVGRGGLKLEGALDAFSVDVRGFVCADIGASTGGFTDCLLQRGALKVFAVDSGSDQLAQSLRDDARVVNIERFNARNLTPETFGCLCDLAVADLSFISQTYVLPNIRAVLREGGLYIGLVKPQFECGRAALDRHGIVKKPSDHAAAIRHVTESAAAAGLACRALIPSPILGGDGNREFLILCEASEPGAASRIADADIQKVVRP